MLCFCYVACDVSITLAEQTSTIREQLTSILSPMMERMIGLEAKSCIQSGTAAYLCAEAILKFVPPAQRAEVHESYDAARKKAVAAMQGKLT